MGRLKVLVIDDDPVLASAIRRMFSLHVVVVEHDAEAALERLRCGEWFDLILCDERLPGIRGSEILTELRLRFGEDAPMLVSMSGDEEISVSTADAQLVKPFRRAEGTLLVEAWRDLKRQRATAATRRLPKI